jgi:multiple sugar transport system permease protein
MSEERVQRILLYFGVAGIFLFCLAPFFYMVLTGVSLRPDFVRPEIPLTLTPLHIETVLTDASLHFLDYLRNSLIISAIAATSAVLVASLAAYALTRLEVPGRLLVLFFILGVSLFPQVSLVSYLYKFMAGLGWINTWQALILPYIAWTLPLAVWILYSYFSQIPRDLDRAALVDGCTRLQVLIRVVLPVAAPGVFSTFLLAFIFAFNEFLFALMLTTDYTARTVPVGIALFEGLHGELPWGEIMAASTVATLPVVLLTLAFQRRIVQGLTRGAVKG